MLHIIFYLIIHSDIQFGKMILASYSGNAPHLAENLYLGNVMVQMGNGLLVALTLIRVYMQW